MSNNMIINLDNKTIRDFHVGDSETCSRDVTEKAIIDFAQVSGDYNPIHINNEYASHSIFKKRIAHGLFCLSMVSYLIGMKLPGQGAVFLNEQLRYLAPAYLGDTITATVSIDSINYEKRRLDMCFKCVNQNNVTCLEGTTLVQLM